MSVQTDVTQPAPFQRPRVRHQGPNTTCIIHGEGFGWRNCTPECFAMGTDKSTRGRIRPTGCTIRIRTGDTEGGTTQRQCGDAVEAMFGIDIEIRTGGNVCSPTYLAGQLKRGRGASVAIGTRPLINTAFRSTNGAINHQAWLNEGAGWHPDARGYSIPTKVLVYDPAADGRATTWGRAADSPDWWPWSLAVAAFAALEPYGERDPRGPLGYGKVYAAIFPDTEPHVHLAYRDSRGFDDTPRRHVVEPPVAGRRVHIRTGPSTAYPSVRTLGAGERFYAYQVNDSGQQLVGSRRWWGNHNGTRWIHDSGIA